MALFKRNTKNKNEVPAEIQEYYQAEKRDRTGIAWLLAIGTLIVTILLAAGIFFAGRWAYRKITGNDTQSNSSETAQSENQQTEQQPEENAGQSEEERRAEAERQRSEHEAREAREAEERRVTEERERRERQEAERREAAQAPTELPSGAGGAGADRQAAAGNSNIPETGPGDTLAIFIAVTILGYMAHRVHFSQKLK